MPLSQRVRSVVAWVVAVMVGLMFLTAGIGKFQMSEAFAERFVAWGLPSMLSPLVGVVETVGGLLAFVPRTAAYGAGIVAAVMIGAVYTHLSTGIGSPVSASVGLLLAVLLMGLRWQDRLRPERRASTDV